MKHQMAYSFKKKKKKKRLFLGLKVTGKGRIKESIQDVTLTVESEDRFISCSHLY